MPDRRQADEIFGEALACPENTREAYLREACGDDDALFAEVLSLLAAHARAAGFLEIPEGGLARQVAEILGEDGAPAAADPLLGHLLGTWRLTRLLGVGGMGRVYLGSREGGGFSQRVAVKVLLHGAFTGDAQRRFRTECQALARLEHPHITHLIDGGVTDDGLPYIAMEYVDGTPVDRYCVEMALSVPQRLRLFQDICAAVEHAHRHSILHRDIKPSNILVDRSGCAKLADFGIARVLDAAEEGSGTLTNVPVMTPQYASPEQLRGELLSTASDVYSLGLVLYRLLTGILPFGTTTNSARELERLVTSTLPLRPSDAVRGRTGSGATVLTATPHELEGDLDAILLMTLRREPERRYASARHLADDLERHLTGLPVLARPDSVRYRAGKYLRRHGLAVGAALVVFVVLVGAAISGFTLYSRAEAARREAVAARARAENEAHKAERISATLIGMIEAADPLATGTGQDLTLREVLAASAGRVEGEIADEPLVAATVHRALGSVYLNLVDLDAAERHIERSLALLRADPAAEPDELMATLTVSGRLAFAREDRVASEAALSEAIAIGASNSTLSAARLVDAEIALAHTLAILGGEPLRAEPVARSALARSQAIDEPASRLPAEASHELGAVLLSLGRYAEAEAATREAIDLARTALGDRHHLVAVYLGDLSLILRSENQPDSAIAAAEEAVAIFTALYPDGHAAVSQTRISLADAMQIAGRREEAIVIYRDAIADLSTRLGPEHSTVGVATNNLAYALSWSGDIAGARDAFERAAEIYRVSLGPDHPELAVTLANLAQANYNLGDRDEAERLCREAVAIQTRVLPDDHYQLAWSRTYLAHLRLVAGDADEACALLEAALPPLRANVPPTYFSRVDGEILLAKALRQTGRAAVAESTLTAALAAADSTAGSDDAGTRRLAAALSELRAP